MVPPVVKPVVDNLKVFGVVILVIAMTVESFAQMCLKIGADGGPAILAEPYASFAKTNVLLSKPLTWKALGVILYGVEIFLWTSVLNLLDVSVAFPMGSLCFVGVAILSSFFLGEKVGRVRWSGVLCIILGTVLMTM
jgi:undecaprenyl phosphate-alpha-L-ara4N flippase subunit ArnE